MNPMSRKLHFNQTRVWWGDVPCSQCSSCLFFLFSFFWEKVLLCILCWPWTHSAASALRQAPCLSAPVLGLQIHPCALVSLFIFLMENSPHIDLLVIFTVLLLPKKYFNYGKIFLGTKVLGGGLTVQLLRPSSSGRTALSGGLHHLPTALRVSAGLHCALLLALFFPSWFILFPASWINRLYRLAHF